MEDFDYDLFISHASEDKAGFVRELVALLEQHGLKVWFDEAELQVGDSLVQSIEDGLRRSRFGVVVLSRAFFAKRWPRAELDSLASREISSGDRVVLPIWLDVGEAEVRQYSPLLADKLALRSEEGVQAIAAKLERRVRGKATDKTPVAEAVRFEPELLRGRVLPYSYSPIVQGDEHALIARVALAARVPVAPEPTLRPATQQLFEDALAGSLLESLLHELTSPLPRPHPEHFWRLVEPTKSWVITAERPAAKMVVDGWTAEARAAISLKHQPSVAPLGWLILHLDVAIRPLVAVPAPETKEWIPLSLDDLFALPYVPLTTLLDEVAPTVVPAVSGDNPEPLALSVLLLPHADPFSRYVRFSTYAQQPRVAGATDASAVDWYPSSLAEIATPEARTASIRDRIEGLFIDGGYRGFEHALERLAPPSLRPAAPT
jgi:TIR domain